MWSQNKNCLRAACLLLCAQVFHVCIYTSLGLCVSCSCEHRCVLFVLRAHVCFVVHGHCLYPGAVLPVRSQVFISLDSGRQITEPQAATHPSFQGLQQTGFNTHYSFPCCYKPNFQLLSICSSSRGVCVKQGCGKSCLHLLWCNFVLFEFALSLMPFSMSLSHVYSVYFSCGALSATSSRFHLCLFAYLCAPLCMWWNLKVLDCGRFWENSFSEILHLSCKHTHIVSENLLILSINHYDAEIRKVV